MTFKFLDLGTGWEVEIDLNDIDQITKSERGTWFLRNTDGLYYEASNLWSSKIRLTAMGDTFEIDVNDIASLTYNYEENLWDMDVLDMEVRK